jgi:hypothetical protein
VETRYTCVFRVAVRTPDTPGKSPETPDISESPGPSTPESPGFAGRNPKTQCSKVCPSKLIGNADLESKECFLPIPYEDTTRATLGK